MWHTTLRRVFDCAVMAILIGLVGCAPARPNAGENKNLVVKILYPTATSNRQMGQNLKCIVEVQDQAGTRIRSAQVTLSVFDPAGKLAGSFPATPGSADLYRTGAWMIPHKLQAGTWKVEVRADVGEEWGTASTTFPVNNSISEDLLGKYGFWVDSPALSGITPDLAKERGDAQNGLIIWGGVKPAQHIFPESWLEVHWRAGDFHLSTADDVRQFMLGTLGDLGFTPVRDLGPFEKVRFKNWDAWQAKARGQYSRYDWQWMVFYAPEVQKTYAISTMVVQAPSGIDSHATLRDGFEVHPEVAANGVAPEPLAWLLPAPELIDPPLGWRVLGTEEPIVLRWNPMKDLAKDEYYEVSVDYNYSETNTTVLFATREPQLVLPQSLYDQPNCGVFNWQVTLMRQTGIGEDGLPEGKALSYGSLYWYVEWLHPAGIPAPFQPRCPNPQT